MTRFQLYRGVGGVKEFLGVGPLVKSIVFWLFIAFILVTAVGMAGYSAHYAWKFWL